jgi:hypothetical protein
VRGYGMNMVASIETKGGTLENKPTTGTIERDCRPQTLPNNMSAR